MVSQTLLKRMGGGRIAALETLFITPAIANLIREGKNFQIPSAMQTGRAYGQKLMNDALIELIQAGKVEPKEAYVKAPDKETFMASLKRAEIDWDPRTSPGRWPETLEAWVKDRGALEPAGCGRGGEPPQST